MTEPLLGVEGLSAHYGRIEALRGISLHVNEGEIVGVVGPNGAGKSTSLLCIAGAVPISSGTVTFGGESIRGKRPEDIVRKGISLVPEGRHILHRLTIDGTA